MVYVRAIFFIISIVILVVTLSVEGAYKKPPFNGSIFGKRSNPSTEYEMVGRLLSSMCETASETCNAWLIHQDSN